MVHFISAATLAMPRWKDDGHFCAFDIPLPGCARFSVDFLARSTETCAPPPPTLLLCLRYDMRGPMGLGSACAWLQQ